MQPRIIPRADHPISRRNIDSDALKVLYRLYRSGHTAFLVGGGVRDLLIGRRPKDFDVSTSARPGQVKKLFRNCWLIGRRFRLAHVHFREHKIVEVSTFRAEPQQEADAEDILVRQDNTFGTPEQDALRRDFTINGLFYDIASFSIIDYVGGVDDIESGVIRTIGDPNIRFREDPVRMIRAIKFAARLDFAIEPETWEAICEHAEEIRKCSTARVLEEIARLMEGGAFCRSVQLMKASGLLRIVLPEVWEYLQGVPAGPGLRPEGRGGEQPRAVDFIEEDLLLHADEDVDHGAQERLLGAMPADVVDDEEEELEAEDLGDEAEDDDSADELEEPETTVDDDSEDVLDEAGDDEVQEELDEEEAAVELLDEITAVLEGDTEEVISATEISYTVVERLEEQPEPEALADEEDEIVLTEDDEGEDAAVLTPQGTRVPQAPDRGGRLWRTLCAVDQLVRSGRTLTRPTLFAALFSPMLGHTARWRAEHEGGEPEQYVMSLLRPLTAPVVITRRDRERVCQILAAQRKFGQDRRGSVGAFARKLYFAESLDLFEIRVLANGEELEELIWWRDRYPPVALIPPSAGRGARLPEELEAPQGRDFGRRRRRRGRGGRGEGGEERVGRDDVGERSRRLEEPVGRGGGRGERDRGRRGEPLDRERGRSTGERGRASERPLGDRDRGRRGESVERGRRSESVDRERGRRAESPERGRRMEPLERGRRSESGLGRGRRSSPSRGGDLREDASYRDRPLDREPVDSGNRRRPRRRRPPLASR